MKIPNFSICLGTGSEIRLIQYLPLDLRYKYWYWQALGTNNYKVQYFEDFGFAISDVLGRILSTKYR